MKSALKGVRTTEAWTDRNCLDNPIDATLFFATTRSEAHRLWIHDRSENCAQDREYDALGKAFEPYQENYSYFSCLEALAQNSASFS